MGHANKEHVMSMQGADEVLYFGQSHKILPKELNKVISAIKRLLLILSTHILTSY